MDQEIFYSIKFNYRKIVLQKVLAIMDNILSVKELSNKIDMYYTVLDANH